MTQFPAVRFRDAVDVVITGLSAGLTALSVNVTVSDKLPEDHTQDDSFVTVRRDGGPSMWPVWDKPQINVASYAPTAAAAADLARDVRTVINQFPGLGTIASCPVSRVDELSGPAFQPDPTSDQPRYVQSFVITLRGYDPADDD